MISPYTLLLHPWRLGVTHPRTDETLNWEAPLPEDFQRVIVNVGRALPAINNLNEKVGGAHPT
ncbi:MAG: hypothetical protein L6277_11245 [Desulfobacterales bacterium]|nr:hypothetical protein [Pseudomonadota bacterium]MCG2772646.1 hypothetical protein [Desulfobacterales bacterium]